MESWTFSYSINLVLKIGFVDSVFIFTVMVKFDIRRHVYVRIFFSLKKIRLVIFIVFEKNYLLDPKTFVCF